MSLFRLSKSDFVLISQPKLIEQFGRSTAQFINQLHFWIEKRQGLLKENSHWIYNTAKEWGKQLCLSDRQIERIIQKLKHANVIKVEHFSKTNRVNYITLNYAILDDLFKNNSDTMSDRGRQEGGIYNRDTKTTNKEIYKSRDRVGELFKNLENSQKQVDKVQENKLSENNGNLQKVTTAEDMINLWNKNFPNSKINLDKGLSRDLVAAFKLKFKEDLTLFELYLKRLQSSTYLMSASFNLSIYWVLKFKTIDRILNGEFGVKEIIPQKKVEDVERDAINHIKNSDESEICKNVRCKILKVLGPMTYMSWFTKVCFVNDDNSIRLKAETLFVKDYITANFGYLFEG